LLFKPEVVKNSYAVFIIGFIGGIILNFHPVSLLYFLPFLILHFIYFKDLWTRSRVLFFTAGLAFSFAPILLFEIRHGFVMFKNTFIVKSYKTFTDSTNPASIVQPSKNPFLNIFVINKLSDIWLVFPILWIAVLNLIIFLFAKKSREARVVFFSFIFSYFLYAVLLRFQTAVHYLFPLYLAGAVSLVVLILNIQNKRVVYLLLAVVISAEIFKFPKSFYSSARRQFGRMFESVKVLQRNLPENSFNIVVIRETPLAILGYEYRYMLRLLGYKSDDEFSYQSSRYLLVVSELGDVNLDDYKSWELDSFGEKELIDILRMGSYTFYLYKKSGL